jgi:uncharacterized integral membrane protein
MRGLYYKDMCCLKKLLRTMIPVCIATLIFALLVVLSIRYGNMGRMLSGEVEEAINEENAPVILFYIIGISLLIPMGFFVDALRCFEMDEQAGFEKVVRTLPVKAADAVTARYLIYLTFGAISMGSSFLSAAIVAASAGAVGIEELSMKNLTQLILMIAAVLLLFCGIQIPLFYALGKKKGTVASLILFLVPVGLLYLKFITLLDALPGMELFRYLMEKFREGRNIVSRYLWAEVVGMVLFYVISYGLSVRFYRKGGRK